MIGAIAGDVIGSYYEFHSTKAWDFRLFREESRFTDDTVLTVAIAEWLLDGPNLIDTLHAYVARFPNAGYGATFTKWANDRNRLPYNSWGNGSAMRVSPVAYAFDSIDEVLAKARRSASVTHNHPEGLKGAQATAGAIFLARTGSSKTQIREFVSEQFGYDLNRRLSDIRPDYQFDVSCQGSVPESILCFLESEDFESAIRNAISLGGDADTMACIAGAVAEAYYGAVPQHIQDHAMNALDDHLVKIVQRFSTQFINRET